MPSEPTEKQIAAAQVVDVFHEISALLNTHLDRRTLSLCISLIENGVNPEALATVIKELRKEGDEVRQQIQSSHQ